MSPQANQNHQGTTSSNASVAAIANSALKAIRERRSWSQEERGDDKLNKATDLITNEVQSIAEENDLRVLEGEVTYAREMKVRLNTKSGIQKFFLAREYNKFAKEVYEHAKFVSNKSYDQLQFLSQPGTSSEAHIYRTARSLYRCLLGCMNAFPSSLTQDKWVADAWNEACFISNAHPNSLRQDEKIKYHSMELLTDLKTKTKSAVESSYEFDSSRAPQSISRNASRAQALLADTTFIYRELNFGRRSRYPYQHPIIQRVVNISWFQDKDDIGVIFHEYFNPIPLEVISLAATVIECCIDEWSTGTYKESNWKEGHYKIRYSSHYNSLRDFFTPSHGTDQEGRDLPRRIQDGILRTALRHAGFFDSELDNIYRTAHSLYQCRLSCEDPFPSSLTQDDWVKDVWEEACYRTKGHTNRPSPNLLPQDAKEFKCSSMELINDMKAKAKSAVESVFEFDTNQAPQSISRNASRAQALLADTTFIYRELNFGGRPRYPYRHPIIQRVVNISWFQDKDDIGVIFHKYFNPIPFEVIALAATVIECCIDEWSTGTCKEANWEEGRYKIRYSSHYNSLRNLFTSSHDPDQEGRGLPPRIQDRLLRSALLHTGFFELDNIYRTAHYLYRCRLSCEDPFPSFLTQDYWVNVVWKEACYRTKGHTSRTSPDLLPQDAKEFKCSSMELINDMKAKAKSAVESSFEFDTNQTPQSIGRNASRSQALLADTAFIYRAFPRYPYRHPIIQKVINIMWFQSKGDIGVIFHEYFAPIPLEALALVLTVIECCIDEWTTGTWKESSWEEVHYQTNHLSHLNSLRDLDNRGPRQEGKALLRGIQDDLLRSARVHAGAPPHPTTRSGRFTIDALDAAVQDDPPEYDLDQISAFS